jgi:hypothetical protein
MHTQTFRLLLGIALMVMLPAMAMAAPPVPVSGVTVELENGGVRVRWDPVEGQTSARIYWSYLSILGNDGAYDDYVVSDSADPEFFIENPPAVDTLFIAVIAENADGEQSPFFIEEASVELGDGPESGDEEAQAEEESSSSEEQVDGASSDGFTEGSIDAGMFASSQPTEQSSSVMSDAESSAPAQDGKFHLLSAESPSPSQVIATFTHPISLEPQDAPFAFTIAAPGGRTLHVLRIEILNERATLTTETQERDAAYQLTTSSVLHGVQFVDGSQISVPLGNVTETVAFQGHAQGSEPQAAPAQGFALDVMPMAGGLFSVQASLTNLPREDIVRYDVYQSIDGGQTFNGPQQVDPAAPSIRVDGIVPGFFIMTLQPVGSDGQMRQALTATATLGGAMPPSIPTPIPVPQPQPELQPVSHRPSPSPALPGAGAGVVTLMGLTSGWAMTRRMRRKLQDASAQ